MPDRPLTYAFGPLESRGILGPIRAGQAAIIATAGLAVITLVDLSPSVSAALVAAVVLAAGVALAFVPIGGRTTEEWLPVVTMFAHRRARGRHRFTSRRPSRGTRMDGAPQAVAPVEEVLDDELPPTVRDVRIITVEGDGRVMGALSERGGRRLTAVIACRVSAFSLLDRAAQERRLAAWGLVLAGAGGTPIHRLQWLERTAPAQGDELARWLHDERDPALPPRGTPVVESYLELISSTARVTAEHEILLAIQVDARRVRDRGRDAVTRALVEQTERVAQGLDAAEVEVLGVLGQGQLARTVRTAFDPFARTELTVLETADPHRDGLSEASAWPLGACESWDHYASDGALHATFWIGGWPRIEVSPMFMDALLGNSGAVRTVAVTFEPLTPARSTREVEAAITRDRADRELRARFGQSETARQRQAAESAMRREAELAAGHAEVRLSGFVTVSGRDPDELRRACAEVTEHASRARLELHRLYGQQAEAFTFSLPLCRGLR